MTCLGYALDALYVAADARGLSKRSQVRCRGGPGQGKTAFDGTNLYPVMFERALVMLPAALLESALTLSDITRVRLVHQPGP